MVPLSELTNKFMDLKSTDSSPTQPLDASSPNTSLAGHLLVPGKCEGHCECLNCMRCIYCATCEECTVCAKCQACKYPARQLKVTTRAVLSNEQIKRRIGIKSKSSPIIPLLNADEILKSKVKKLETKNVGDKTALETKYVGDKKALETKRVGDNLKLANDKAKPLLVHETNRSKVSKLINFNVDVKVHDLTEREKKLISFCHRRITINNRRLQVQREFRESGLITQNGVFRLHDSTDKDFWVTVSLVGYTDIIVPRCGLELLGVINFCPHINWTVIGSNGHSESDLTFIGQILNQHVLFDNRVSIQPIRFSSAEGTEARKTKSSSVKVVEPKAKKPVVPPPTVPIAPPAHVITPNGFPISPPPNRFPH